MSSRSGAAAGSDSASSTPMHTLTKIKKEQWVSDDMATSCYGCGADFTITTRKHHCRLCGNCFCNSCSSKRLSHRRKKSDAEEEDDGGANGSNENARGRSDEVSARKKTSIFAKTWKKGISALTGDVKQIRVCDSCYETERILASTGGAAPADAIHLESSDEEGGDKSSSTRAPKSTTSPGGSATASSGLASGAHPPRLMKAPTRRGGLPGLGDGESDEEGDSSSGKPGSDALRGKLERSNRKVRLTKEEEAAAATAGGAATSPSAAATASAVHPASPLPVHSPIHCLFARHFRVGAREKIKLLIPDPVLLYFGNKKHVNDLTGLGDGGVFGSAAAHHSSHSSSHSNTAQHSGPAAIWNHLRSVIHGHACEHAKENHSPSTPQDQHFDCQVPHITKCAETFPFRYGALAITNYQIIWLPMLLPPHVNAKGASAIQNNYKASTYCTSCSNATETPHSPSSSSAAITTSTCCSSCGCMPLVNSWEHIANNSVAYRTQHASVPSHNNSSSDYLSSHIVPHSHPSQCDTCVPIMPICIPLLSVGRFRLRTFEKADLGLLEVRSKTFVHLRLLFPGLISRNRFGHFRNIAICIDYFSKIRPEGHQHAISTSGDTESGWGSSKKDTGGSSKDNEEGSTSGHEVINESEVSGLKKIAFAWKWDSDCDTLRDLPPLSESPTAAEEERGLIRLHGVDARRTTRTNRRRETASLAPPQQVEDANASAFVGSEELLSEDESDSESTASSTTSNNNATAPVAPIPQSTSSTTMTLNSTTTQSQAEEDKRVQLQRSLSKASISSGFIPASLAIPPKQTTAAAAVGWHVYDPISEYTRLGLFAPTSHYRMSSLNAQFRFSPTYPKVLIVPKGVSEKELEGIAPFRSKARIPCVVWSRTNYSEAQIAAQAVSTMGSLNGSGNYSQLQSQSQTQSTSISNMSRVVPNAQTVMLRSAQPMVGITRTRNHNDELFMQWVVANSPSNKRFIIADARPLANAMAQQALGKGYELTENYQSHIIRDIQIQFMDIGNIHVMRTSEEALSKLCQHYQESLYINATGALSHVSELCVNKRYCNQNNTHVPQFHSCGSSSNTEPATPATPASPLSVGLCPHACSCTCCFTNVGSHGLPTDFNAWWSGLLATGHFEHLTAILRAANFIVQTIQSGTSCLVHCSDGWDRTSQLTSLSQLALDPYYRTLHGFFVLICKEWLSFGHKFTERLGHGGIGGRENSPVFTQWLDCVYQYLHQFPTRFEFNADLLLALRHSLHSGKYGTWFANSESERAAAASSNSASSPASNNSSTAAHASGSLWKLMDKTPSIFSQLWFYRHRFLNAQYEYSPSSSDGQPFLDAQSEYARNRPLLLDLHGITFWKEFYLPGICIKQDVLKPSEATVMAATSAAEKQGAATSAVQAEEAKQLREAVEKQKRLIQEQEDKLTRALEELAAMKRAAAAAAATPPAVATVAAATTPDPTPAPAVQPEEEREAVVCTPSPETVVEDAAADDSVSALVSMTDPVISETTTVIGQDLIPAPPTSQPMTRDAAVSDPAPRHSLASASEASSSSSNAAADLESTLPATVEEEEDQFDESGLLKHTRPRAVRNTGSLISPAALAKAAAEANADGLNGDEEPLSPPAGSHPLLDPALVATRQSRQRSRSSILPSEVAKQQAAAQNRLLGGPPSQHNSNPSTPASNFTSASNPNAGPPLPSFRPTSPLRRALSPVGNQPGGVPANTSTGGGSMRDAKSMWGVILRRQGPSLPQKLRAAAHTVVQSSPPASAVATTTATAGTGGTASVAAPASPAHATAANGTVASTPPLTPTHSITAAESTVSTIPSTPPPASATFAAPPSISTTPVSHASERRDSELGPPTPPFPNQLLNSRTKSIELAPVNEHDIARAPSTPSSSTTSSSTFTPSSASSSIALPRSASNPHVTPSTSMQASDRRVDHAAVVFSSSDESEGEDNAENRRGSMVTSQSSGNNNHYHSSKGVEWKDDDSTAACSLCREVFTFFNRRHHCRRCGDVYCNSCCPKLNLDSNLIPGMMALGAMGHNNDLDQQTPQKKKKTKTRLCLACKKENKVHINSPAPTTEEQQQ